MELMKSPKASPFSRTVALKQFLRYFMSVKTTVKRGNAALRTMHCVIDLCPSFAGYDERYALVDGVITYIGVF